MDERNKVTVIVYGQEFTLSGDMPREQILKMADKVDTVMNEVGAGSAEPMSKIAVLAGMLIADEGFKLEDDIEGLLTENGKLDAEAKRYEQMWEEVKASFAKYKEDVAALETVKNNLQSYVSEKEQQLTQTQQHLSQVQQQLTQLQQQYNQSQHQLVQAQQQLTTMQQESAAVKQQNGQLQQQLQGQVKYAEELKANLDSVSEQARNAADVPQQVQRHVEELENKCRDIESSFFDIQMENIHLKNEIETLRGRR